MEVRDAITRAAAAKLIDVAPSTINRAVMRGELEVYRTRDGWPLLSAEEVKAWKTKERKRGVKPTAKADTPK